MSDVCPAVVRCRLTRIFLHDEARERPHLPWKERGGEHSDTAARQLPAAAVPRLLRSHTGIGCQPATVAPSAGAHAQLREAKQTHRPGPPTENERAGKVDWIWQEGEEMLLIGWAVRMRRAQHKRNKAAEQVAGRE